MAVMLEDVASGGAPLVVTRAQGDPVVVLSVEDYRAMAARSRRRPAASPAMIQLARAMSEVDELAFTPGTPGALPWAPQPKKPDSAPER